MARFSGKTVLVTGAGSGIGRTTARAFAAEEANVVLGDTNLSAVEELAHELGSCALPVRADVSNKDDVRALITYAIDEFGSLDCAFNNAGIGGAQKSIFDASYADWDRIIRINLSSIFYCIKAEAEAMREKGGAIVNTASVAGLIATPNNAEYIAAKHGVVGLTKACALDLIPHGIRVNAICPGPTDTSMLARALANPEIERYLKSILPIGRIASPNELAKVVLFLASEDSSYLVGQCIAVDGGISVQ